MNQEIEVQKASETGYRYFSRDGAEAQYRRNVDGCAQLGSERLHPPLREMDYLIYELRRRVIEPWSRGLKGTDLNVMDIGGRIQPYRSLFEGRLRHYVAVDLLLEGLVDVIGTAEALPFQSDSFDVVLCNDVIQYIPDPRLAVCEMHRVLKPGGILILSTRAQYPEHHDEYWRFLPLGLRILARDFSTVQVDPEGASGAGLFVALNVLLHRDITRYRLMQIAQRTSIPLLNLLGLGANILLPRHRRFACGYSLLATK